MRSIRKGPEPRELRHWKSDNAESPQNLRYGGGGFPAEAVRQALLKEQLHLCAYTMKRLITAEECGGDTRNSCHIEHFMPQCRKVPGEDIDYQNMLACFPPSQSMSYCGYGATYKADFDPSTKPVVSPLSQHAQSHFDFDRNGGIIGQTEAGANTIRALCLDRNILINDRKAVIKGFLEPRGKPVSAAAARRHAEKVLQPDEKGCLQPYCVAIAAAATAYAERVERRAARMRMARAK